MKTAMGFTVPHFLAGAALGIAVLAGVPLLNRSKRGRLLSAALPAAVLLVCILFSGAVKESLCCCINGWILNRRIGAGKMILLLEAGEMTPLYGVLLLNAAAGVVTGRLVRCMGLFALLPFGLGGLLLIGLLPEQAGVLCNFALLTGCGCALVCGGRRRAVTAVLLVLALTASGCLLLGDTGVCSDRNRRTQALLHSSIYEKNGAALSEGDLTAGKSEENMTRLTVQMEQAEPLYLRGFVGGTYTGSGWQPLSDRVLAENADTLYWLKKTGFDPRFQTAAVADTLKDTVSVRKNTVTVGNVAECSLYAYLPYGAEPVADDPMLLREDTLVQRRSAGAAYTFSTVYAPGELIALWVDGLNNADAEQYRRAADSYRRFAEENYTEVPDTLRAALTPLLDSARQQLNLTDGLTTQDAIDMVATMLEQYLTYDPQAQIAVEEDYVLSALKSGRGDDRCYATVTVLALRCCGMAARYGEGYTVTRQKGERAVDAPLALTDSNTHAWAEIYQEGVGWIPLELTPGYAAAMGSAAQTARVNMTGDGPGTSAVSGSAPLQEGETYEPQNQESETDPDSRSQQPKDTFAPVKRVLLITLCGFVFLLAVPALFLVLRRRKTLKRRAVLLKNGQPSEAAAWQFAYAMKLLEVTGVKPGTGSLAGLADPLMTRFGADYADYFGDMAQLNMEALFSPHPLNEETPDSMEKFVSRTLGLVLEKQNLPRRLKMKYIRCLY